MGNETPMEGTKETKKFLKSEYFVQNTVKWDAFSTKKQTC